MEFCYEQNENFKIIIRFWLDRIFLFLLHELVLEQLKTYHALLHEHHMLQKHKQNKKVQTLVGILFFSIFFWIWINYLLQKKKIFKNKQPQLTFVPSYFVIALEICSRNSLWYVLRWPETDSFSKNKFVLGTVSSKKNNALFNVEFKRSSTSCLCHLWHFSCVECQCQKCHLRHVVFYIHKPWLSIPMPSPELVTTLL